MRRYNALYFVLLVYMFYGCSSAKGKTSVVNNTKSEMINNSNAIENQSQNNSELKIIREDNVIKKDDTIIQARDIKKISNKTYGKIILITLTEACKCTLQRCNEAGVKVKEMVGLFPGKIEFEVVYYNLDKTKASAILDKYGGGYLPVAVLLDNSGTLVYKSDFTFDYLKLQEVFEELKKESIGDK